MQIKTYKADEDLIEIYTNSAQLISLEFRPLREWRDYWPFEFWYDSQLMAFYLDLCWVEIMVEVDGVDTTAGLRNV